LNRVAWFIAAAVLALASVGVAQPGLIVEPWGATQDRAELSGRFRITQRVHTFNGTATLIVDPWGSSSATEVSPVRPRDRGAVTEGASVWASAGEIVDPWASSRRRAASVRLDTLIVDPWQR
jgi:hypothetical protein